MMDEVSESIPAEHLSDMPLYSSAVKRTLGWAPSSTSVGGCPALIW